MQCCVQICRNHEHFTNNTDVSLIEFPHEVEARRAWFKSLKIKNHRSRTALYVCSEHFRSDDIYQCGDSLKVKDGVMPVMLNYCHICLDTERKMCRLSKEHLLEAFQILSGVPNQEVVSNIVLCWECISRLITFHNLMKKASSAQKILRNIAFNNNGSLLTPDKLKDDRETHKLTSSLKVKVYEPQHYDFKYNEEETEREILQVNVEEEETNLDNEEEIFIKENSDLEAKCSDADYASSDDVPVKRKKKVEEKKGSKIDRRKKELGDDLDEKIFSSTLLSKEEQMTEFQKRKDTSNYKNAVHKCTECYKGFLDEEAYSNHVVRHTERCGVYKCDICKLHFKQSHALRNHITSHSQKFSCKCCAYVTFRKQTAKLHEEWHNGTRYKCPHCQEEFLKFTTYMGHIRIKHPSDCVCALCGYSFVSEKGLRLHKKLKHRLEEESVIPSDGPNCVLCGVRFYNKEAHAKHLQVSSRHTENGPVNGANIDANLKKSRKARESSEDGVSGKKQRDLRKKRQNPKPEGPIPCEQCGIQLEDSRAYYKHFRRMHPDKNRTNYPSMKSPCMCEVCGRMFQTLALLQDHSWVHTNEKRFECDLCHKTFQQKQRLVAHKHIHSQSRNTYVCNVCGKHFTTHSNRQRHMFSHTGLKPFKCEMCGKGFKHASEKRAHVTYVHLKKPWPKRARHKRKEFDGQNVHRDEEQRGMDVGEPLWHCADPKSDQQIVQEKHNYYNLKI